MKTYEQQGGKSIQEILKQNDAVIATSWPKLGSLIMAFEQIGWHDASDKARELIRTEKSMDYVREVREFFESKAKPDPAPQQKKTDSTINSSRDVYSMNYKRLLKVVPELVEQLEAADAELHGKSKATGYMDLHFDLVGKNKRGYYVALSHYYKQNGDMIADPDMVIRVDVKSQTVEALTYQDSFGYKEVYDNYMNPQTVMPREQKAQNSFLASWLRNLIHQEHQIEFDEPENDTPPKPEKRKADIEKERPESEPEEKPDVSYMDENVIAEIKATAQKSVLDDLLKIITEKIEGKLKLRPVAEYFFVERINSSPLGITLAYPKDQDLKKDYELLLERSQNLEKADKVIAAEQSGKAGNNASSKINRLESSSTNQLYKFNYQLLSQLIPEISDTKIETLKGTLKPKQGHSGEFYFEGMEPTSANVQTLSVQGTDTGLQFIAINVRTKKVWLLGRVGNFDGKPDYQHEKAEPYEKLKANKQLGKWLDSIVSKKFKAIYEDQKTQTANEWDDDVNSKIPDFEPGKVQLTEAHKKAGISQKHIDWINKNQMGMTLTPVKNMKNNTENFLADMAVQALKPGFRISKTGKLYRENRSNRSDLTKGGL